MTVRAKFRCLEKQERWIGGPPDEWDQVAVEVKFQPMFEFGDTVEKTDVSGATIRYGLNAVEENLIFGKATPAGSIAMLIKNADAAAEFELGRAYYVDFTPADG